MSDSNNNHLDSIFQIIADDAMMGFIVFEIENNNCIYANKLACRLLEVGMDQNFSKLTVDCMIPPPVKTEVMSGFRQLNTDMFANEGLYQGVMIQKLNGHQFIGNLGVKKDIVNGKEHLVLMVQDTTIQMKLQREVTAKQVEIRAAYESLVQQNKQLLELDKAKDKFISMTTHELRTPTSAMLATTDVLINKLYDTDEERDEFIQMIYDQGKALLELINDVLDLSKIQAGRMDYYIQQHNLTPIVEDEIEQQENMAQLNNLTIHTDFPDIMPKVWVDDIRIRQVIRNLISNAIKYNRKDGQIFIKLEHSPEFNLVRLYVEDTGHGIPEEQQHAVFNEFETLGSVSNHQKGTGLGMPISRQMMQEMGGTICLKSEVSKGSTFWLEIPTEQVLENPDSYRERPSLEDDLAAI
ncbi:MAG: hypothetical protein CL677_03855 [Bdellovibrionaceae bacterium]|nr:hypothetical protein [Pseudobdellovibrionaceae bacterium]|tara:strand:+ start:18813 stop:20042 length:1230 start_codon:yes stop_codon:yes gene_type:complete